MEGQGTETLKKSKRPQKRFDFIKRLQARTALLAIGRSTLRNQGAPGVVAAARKYLASMNLREFSVTTRSMFETVLEEHTQLLLTRFPRKARRNWGAARKSLNIFLRDVNYSRQLCAYYGLSPLTPWLELPLDSNTYKGLDEDSSREIQPWRGVKGLKPPISTDLQAVADEVAKGLAWHRVDLDVKYWRRKSIDALQR